MPLIGMTTAAILTVPCSQLAARAVIVVRDPGRNLAPPTGEFAQSGWQFEGDWHRFAGTVIGPHHFITARHVGGYPLQPFRFRGRDYYALERITIEGTDIALWRVTGTFPEWAPLYDGTAERGRGILIYGRGGPRGKPLIVRGKPRGWWWSESDGALSWGRNRVTEVINHGPRNQRGGSLLAFRFDPARSGAGPDTAAVSGGDSGGGVFLRDDDGIWKLAGVTFGVDRAYSLGPQGEGSLPAALYDARGLYRIAPMGRFFIAPSLGNPEPTTALVSRISPHVPFLREAMARPPRWPFYAGGAVLCLTAPLLAGVVVVRRRRSRTLARLRLAREAQPGAAAVNDAGMPR
jgi:hypothetical protein